MCCCGPTIVLYMDTSVAPDVGDFVVLLSTSALLLQVWNTNQHEDLQMLVIVSRPPVKV